MDFDRDGYVQEWLEDGLVSYPSHNSGNMSSACLRLKPTAPVRSGSLCCLTVDVFMAASARNIEGLRSWALVGLG